MATLILAVLVTIWHVPLFFLEGSLQPFQPALVLGSLLGSFVATWLFNRTGGSVLLTIFLHAAEGTPRTGALWPAAAGQASLVYSLVWLAVVIGLVVFDWQTWRGPAPATVQPAYGGECRVR